MLNRRYIGTLLLLALLLLPRCGEDAAIAPSFGEITGDLSVADSMDSGSLDGTASDTGEITGTCTVGEPCDDGNPCTLDDFCKGGVCTGETVDCSDELDCTLDVCLPDGTCSHPLRNGFCLILDTCFADGDFNPLFPCLECITAVTTDQWTAQDGASCDDQDACTSNDRCQAGACVGTPLECPNQGPCMTAQCVAGECQPTFHEGSCGADACGEHACVEGVCVATSTLDCYDENLCTDDLCDPVQGCLFLPNTNPCDDGNACTVNDSCTGGVCLGEVGTVACDDGNPCTDDSCHPELGCVHFPNNGNCDDGDPCLTNDFCVAGVCLAGVIALACDDGNVCTDDMCEPFVGCVATNNTAACDDLDPCFSADQCADGTCSPGGVALDCDDGNPCTLDGCEPFAGCYHQLLEGPCDDGNACTLEDTCQGGQCLGEILACTDGNGCTKDSCNPATGCQFTPLTTKACRPAITITYPPRGATLSGDPVVTVTGTVLGKAGAIAAFSINGEAVLLDAEGGFAHPMASVQGMNLIVAEAVDEVGGKARTTPSYYFSTTWYQPDISNPAQGMVPDGIMAFLGPEVWDDNDTSDVDDLATIMALYLQAFDLSSMITNPVTSGTQGWCNYKVNVANITYGDAEVDLLPVDGGLHLLITIPAFAADVAIPMSGFLCPSVNGTATATSITIEADVVIAMVNGVLTAEMVGTNVSVNNLDITLDGIWGFLLNWLVNFFEGQFAAQLESEFETQLGALIPATIVDALSSLALDQTISVPPIMGNGPAKNLQLKTALHSVDFKAAGATLGLSATVVTTKGVQHAPLGSIGRAACLSSQAENFAFPALGQLEIGLHDDFFNQLPYAMYWAGMFDLDVDPAALGADLSQFGLTNVQLHVDFLLPTIITSCTEDGAQVMQIGDLRVDGTMQMAGSPVDMEVYVSLEVEAEVIALDNQGKKELSVALGDVRVMEVEVTQVTGPLAGAEEVLVGLIEENLVAGLLDSFSAGALGSFPIPDIDLSGFDASIPPGSGISLDLQQILSSFGYTVLSGNVL
jgi:hypothetical protein